MPSFLAVRLLVVIVVAGSAAPVVADARPLRAMSYNILNADWRGNEEYALAPWANRRALVFATIAEAGPDVIGLQEVNRAQYSDLVAYHPDFAVCWAAAHKNSTTEVGNAIMYRISRFEPIGTCQSELFESVGQGRGRVWVKLRDKVDTDGNVFTFVSTHFAHDNPALREAASDRIVESLGPGDSPMLLVGDFNAWNDPWSDHPEPKYRAALNRLTAAGFQNIFWPVRNDATEGSTVGNSRIDHIFALGSVEPSDAFIVGRDRRQYDDRLAFPVHGAIISLGEEGDSYPSDHFGIGVSVILTDL